MPQLIDRWTPGTVSCLIWSRWGWRFGHSSEGGAERGLCPATLSARNLTTPSRSPRRRRTNATTVRASAKSRPLRQAVLAREAADRTRGNQEHSDGISKEARLFLGPACRVTALKDRGSVALRLRASRDLRSSGIANRYSAVIASPRHRRRSACRTRTGPLVAGRVRRD